MPQTGAEQAQGSRLLEEAAVLLLGSKFDFFPS